MKKLLLFCLVFLPALVSHAAAGGTFAVGGSNSTTAQKGIDKEVWIAIRTDGFAGTGTATDPFDGSTTAKFDTVLRTAVGDGTYGGGSCIVHLGAGIFTSAGSKSITDDIFKANNSYQILGAGVGVTTLKLANTIITGTTNNVFLLRNSGNSGNVAYFELGQMSLELNAAQQPIVSTNGVAEAGAVKVFCVRGYLHDLAVNGVYCDPPEGFPVQLATRSIAAVAVDGHHVIERVTVTPATGNATDDMTAISIGDPGWDSVAGNISGRISDCQVFGNGTQVAFGGFSLNGVTVQNNYSTNCYYGWVSDSWTNRNVIVTGNRFSYAATGASFTGSAGTTNGQFLFNTLDFPRGGSVVFASTAQFASVFGNLIDPGYALNVDAYAILAGMLDTNYFKWSGSNVTLFAGPVGTNYTNIVVYGTTDNTGLDLKRPDAGADAKNWVFSSTASGTLGLNAFDDTGALSTAVFNVARSGWTAGTWSIYVPLYLTGTLDATQGITNGTLTANTLVGSDANKKEISITAGSGLSLAGGTLSAATAQALASLTITNNIGLVLTEANPTNVVDIAKGSQTNILDGPLTLVHATNGVTGQEITAVRYFLAGGSDRALTVPAAWRTNVNSAVPANITNGTITVMYCKSIGDTSTSANQTNVLVSFEFYK